MTNSELTKRINRLTPTQCNALAAQLSHEVAPGNYKTRRIVAYVAGTADLNQKELREKLKSKLPAYMVPAVLVRVDKIPRLPNGKVDHRALPALNENSASKNPSHSRPRTPIEKLLTSIWEDVLNVHPVGLHDNFFEIGGDSILSIQIVAKARKEGLVIGPNLLFEHQTISELSLFVQAGTEVSSEHSPVSGATPLTPIQSWFFEEHKTAPHHWNHIMAFEIDAGIPATRIKEAVYSLVKHHDALRFAFRQRNGMWESTTLESAEESAFHYSDLSTHPKELQEEFALSRSREIQQDFSLADGRLFQALMLEREPVQRNELILIAHHLIVDAVSWQIITDDLNTLLQHPQAMLPKSVAYQTWSAHLRQAVDLGKFDSELPFWIGQEIESLSLPFDFGSTLPVIEESVEIISFSVDPSRTRALMKDALGAYKMRPDEILIAAFLKAVGNWSGTDELTLWLERHGRQSMDQQMDLSRTVGWFTAFYPLRLRLDRETDSGTALKHVKEQLREVPNGGIGYGALRYLKDWEGGDTPRMNGKPLVIFNFLGTQSPAGNTKLGEPIFIVSGSRAPQSERNSFLEVNSLILGGELKMRWTFSRSHFQTSSIRRVVDNFDMALRDMLDHCLNAESGEYTPSDFPEAGLSQDDLDSLLNSL